MWCGGASGLWRCWSERGGGYFQFFSVIQTIPKALKCSFREHAVETTTFGAIAVKEFQ